MSKVNRSWMAAVAAALLLGTLVGVVWARPNDLPGAADITRKVILGGADFSTTHPSYAYNTVGGEMVTGSSYCVLAAPVVFPCLPSVTVERIKLHVHDQNPTEAAGVHLFRVNPANGAHVLLGSVESPTGMSDGRKTYTSAAINKVVWPSQRAYVRLWFEGTSIWVHGVTVEYHRNI